jgi:hypothetical protein
MVVYDVMKYWVLLDEPKFHPARYWYQESPKKSKNFWLKTDLIFQVWIDVSGL